MQLRVVAEAWPADVRTGIVAAQDYRTEVAQEITHLAMSTIGYAAIEKSSWETTSYFDNRKLSIFSGSNEIQRNIVAKRILGL